MIDFHPEGADLQASLDQMFQQMARLGATLTHWLARLGMSPTLLALITGAATLEYAQRTRKKERATHLAEADSHWRHLLFPQA